MHVVNLLIDDVRSSSAPFFLGSRRARFLGMCLSPLYLLPLDSILRKHNYPFPRYADDPDALYFGVSHSSLSRLQLVQNAAARLLARTSKREHITPVLAWGNALAACPS